MFESISPNEFAARFTSSGIRPPLSTIPSIIGSSDPSRTANSQAVGIGVTGEAMSWVKAIMSATFLQDPTAISEKVAVPLANRVEKVSAGIGQSVSDVADGVRSAALDIGNYTKWALVVVVIFGGLYLVSLLAQPILLARAAR